MARIRRPQIPGGFYHVTTRGNRRQPISLADFHVFERRFRSVVVEEDEHILELARYVVLNPVRAGLCQHAAQWRWSSYRAMMGPEKPPPFLTCDWLLSRFGPTPARARTAYRDFVAGRLLAA
jgi:hypothetical protein